jgi:hypothetical protein
VSEEEQQSQAVPFFARYLENQLPEDVDHLRDLSEEEIEAIGGGTEVITLKFPSDNEDGHGKVTNPFSDEAFTSKYPSDGDDFLPPNFHNK